MRYIVDDKALDTQTFIQFVNRVWPGRYDVDQTQLALSRTLNITAYDKDQLVGCIRILTDGYYFGTITELLVLPGYRKQGIGRELMRLTRLHTPTTLYFGAQPGVEDFYDKCGCYRGMQSFVIKKKRT